MLREIDNQKRKADPTFKGAFHEKKRHFPTARKPSGNISKGRRSAGGRSKRK
jgi:ATP-dependent RNA helicase RhlE